MFHAISSILFSLKEKYLYSQKTMPILFVLYIITFWSSKYCLSLNFNYIYLTQYLELWKVTICKMTELSIVFWGQKYLSLELHKMEEFTVKFLKTPCRSSIIGVTPGVRVLIIIYVGQKTKMHKYSRTIWRSFRILPCIRVTFERCQYHLYRRS